MRVILCIISMLNLSTHIYSATDAGINSVVKLIKNINLANNKNFGLVVKECQKNQSSNCPLQLDQFCKGVSTAPDEDIGGKKLNQFIHENINKIKTFYSAMDKSFNKDENYIKALGCEFFCMKNNKISLFHCPEKSEKKYLYYEQCLQYQKKFWEKEYLAKDISEVVQSEVEELKVMYKKLMSNQSEDEKKALNCILDNIKIISPANVLSLSEKPYVPSSFIGTFEKIKSIQKSEETENPFCIKNNFYPTIKIGYKIFNNSLKRKFILAHEIGHLVANPLSCKHSYNDENREGMVFKEDGKALNTWTMWSKEIEKLQAVEEIQKKKDIDSTYKAFGINLFISKGDEKLTEYSGLDNTINEALADVLATKALLADCKKSNLEECESIEILKSLCLNAKDHGQEQQISADPHLSQRTRLEKLILGEVQSMSCSQP